MKVYGLKRATPKMKYMHMCMVMDWKASLKEHQAAFRLLKLRETQSRLMTQLADLDPNWEAWFDDDANVPAYGSLHQRVTILQRRISELTTPQPPPPIPAPASAGVSHSEPFKRAQVVIAAPDAWHILGPHRAEIDRAALEVLPALTCPVVDLSTVNEWLEQQVSAVVAAHLTAAGLRDVDRMLAELLKLGVPVTGFDALDCPADPWRD